MIERSGPKGRGVVVSFGGTRDARCGAGTMREVRVTREARARAIAGRGATAGRAKIAGGRARTIARRRAVVLEPMRRWRPRRRL